MAHEYDEIREHDNPTPGWWKLIFLVCCLLAVGYWFYYKRGPGVSESESHEAEDKAFRASVDRHGPEPMDEARLAALVAEPAVIKAGRKVFEEKCVACHRYDGGGQVGPNLTDTHQIHGSTGLDIHKTIRVGVPAKGMIAWEPVLKPEVLDAVTAYVVSLIGKNVEGGKAAEGNPISNANAEQPDGAGAH